MSARRVIVEVLDTATLVATNVPTRLRMIASTTTGPQGATGATGPTGPAGAGFPSGGATGTVLSKLSATNYDTTWATRDSLATDTAWSSRYVAKTDDDLIWIPAPSMGATNGSAALANVNTFFGFGPAWLLDQNTNEQVGTSVVIPDFWATFKCELYWANAASSSGNVRLAVSAGYATAGQQVDGSGRPTRVIFHEYTVAAPTTIAELAITQFPTATNVSNTAGRPLWITPWRRANDASDTLPNDVAIYGVLLTRMS